MGAAPRKYGKRLNSDPGDINVLGGRTGRDGIGGATGSSKVHTEASIEVRGAEVQKGNAPTERKIQRMFRRPKSARIIKKCNDFGAGGVSVAIGELAASRSIWTRFRRSMPAPTAPKSRSLSPRSVWRLCLTR